MRFFTSKIMKMSIRRRKIAFSKKVSKLGIANVMALSNATVRHSNDKITVDLLEQSRPRMVTIKTEFSL